MRVTRVVPIGLMVAAGVAWKLRTHPAVVRIVEKVVKDPTANVPDGVPDLDIGLDEADVAEVVELVRDPEELGSRERDLLTVAGAPGETHRRRDQTAGVAAQQLAAAQVSQRRNGIDDY